MSLASRLPLSTAALIILGCAGSVAWQDSCSCGLAWVGLASELGSPDPSNEAVVAPEAVAESLRLYLNSHRRPAMLDELRAIGVSFHNSCVLDGVAIKCTFWLWYQPGRERGVEVQVPYNPNVAELQPGSVNARYVFRST